MGVEPKDFAFPRLSMGSQWLTSAAVVAHVR
jgi:hypothetical protein